MNGILKLLIDTLIFTREEESVEETSSMYNQQPANHPNHPVDSHKLQPTSKPSKSSQPQTIKDRLGPDQERGKKVHVKNSIPCRNFMSEDVEVKEFICSRGASEK